MVKWNNEFVIEWYNHADNDMFDHALWMHIGFDHLVSVFKNRRTCRYFNSLRFGTKSLFLALFAQILWAK